MEDFDFDQLFSDKMRQSGAPDLSAADWQQLSGRLDEFDRQRHRVFPMWWLAALTGLLLLSNLGWWAVWQNTRKIQEQLATEWQQIRQQVEVQHDTVVKQTTVYVYDTIRIPENGRAYNRLNNIQSGSEGYTFANNHGYDIPTDPDRLLKFSSNTQRVDKQVFISNATLKDNVRNANGNQLNRIEISASADNNLIDKKDGLGNKTEEDALVTPVPNLNLPGSITHKSSHLVVQPITDLPLLVKRAPLVSPLRHATVGISVSSMHALSPAIIFSGGMGVGIMGEIPITHRLGLTLQADYARIQLRGYILEPSLGLPTPHSPGSEFDFKYFETHDGRKPVFNLGLGGRYWVRPHKLFSPFIGVGYTAQWHPEYEIEMEFVNRNSGLEKSKNIEVDDEGKPISMLNLNLGGRISLTRRVQLQAGGYYQLKINPERRGIPRYIGLKAAFLYEL